MGLGLASCISQTETERPAETEAASAPPATPQAGVGTVLETNPWARSSVEHLARSIASGAASSNLRARRIFTDDEGMTHVTVQQHVRGVPILGAQAIVHWAAEARVSGPPNAAPESVTDSLERRVSVDTVDTTPALTATEAIERALSHVPCPTCLTSPPQADLLVLVEGATSLAYRVKLRRVDGTKHTSMPVLFIDAQDGRLLSQYDNLQRGTGVSNYSGTVAIATYQSPVTGAYTMEDLGRKLGTVDNRLSTDKTFGTWFTDTDDVWNDPAQATGVDVQYGMAKTYDYYLNVHGRKGIDGAGGPTPAIASNGTPIFKAITEYGYPFDGTNAFWDSDAIVFGQAKPGVLPRVSLDVVGHEWTHGVIEKTSGLTYRGESGSLDESLADIFGAMVERSVRGESPATWMHGEDYFTPGVPGDADRYFATPHAAVGYGSALGGQPDHYSERSTGLDVHSNSGIGNKAFHLLAKGGTHHLGGTMTGVGADVAAKIFYKAMTAYMTESTDFEGARAATLQSAKALGYGAASSTYKAVDKAWCMVGVGPGKLAFTVVGSTGGSVFVSNADGSGKRQLTKGRSGLRPSWSPDGHQVVYDSEGGLRVINWDGSADHSLTSAPGMFPSWSKTTPGKIAFMKVFFTGTESPPYGIAVINPDGTALTSLTNTTYITDWGSTWSPDGTRIAFERQNASAESGSHEIFIMNSDGSNLTQFTQWNVHGAASNPRWSPDGQRIAFDCGGAQSWEVCVMDVGGSGFARLTPSVGNIYNINPAWSPDGKQIAFASSRDYPNTSVGNGQTFELYSMNADGTNPKRLTRVSSTGQMNPSWGTCVP